jgi:saccharopine dehydrogenase-like NADP-dependent oxidoreductase
MHRPELEKLIAACDIVISLLPWTMHTPIAELAVKHKVHFGSTSYISDAMDALGDAFKANGKV